MNRINLPRLLLVAVLLGAAALFGPALGTLCGLTGATLGATLAFLIARYLSSDWVARRMHKHMGWLMQGVET